MAPIIECVPNVSEGRRPEVVAAIVAAVRAVREVHVLDVSSDPDHHRSVITFVGPPDGVAEAAFRLTATAQQLIDLNLHHGAHPRLGATDVIPFIPIRDVTMADCAGLARAVGQRIGTELGIPVYLYEAAASRPERRNLADVRRGEYEGLQATLGHDPLREPDFGPRTLSPAGATIVGARPPLIAYNVYLSTAELSIAKAVAKAIRGSSGGLVGVKALGLLVDGRAQVSMNLTDFRTTPLPRVWALIKAEAARYGVVPTASEVVGLLPEDALLDVAEATLQLNGFRREQLLERRLAALAQAAD